MGWKGREVPVAPGIMTAIIEGEQRAAMDAGVPRRSGRARMPSDLTGQRMPAQKGRWARREELRRERERVAAKRAVRRRVEQLRREGAQDVRVSTGGVVSYRLPVEKLRELYGGCRG